MLVVPGQAVEAGQGLIGTARAERDGTLIFQPAAGSVRAQFEWENEQDIALLLPIEQLTGQQAVHRTLFWDGHAVALPSLHPAPGKAEAEAVVRHYQPEVFGLPVPVFIEETTYYYKASTDLERTEEQALAPSTSAPAMRRFMIMDFCYFSSGVVSARSSFRSNSYFVWQKWQTTSHFGSSSRSFTSSLRPRLRSISFVRSLLQSH